MATEGLEIAQHRLRRIRKLLCPPSSLLRPCCPCCPSRTRVMREAGRRRFGCLCSDTWPEPSCWPAWLCVRPGTSGKSHFSPAEEAHQHALCVDVFDLVLTWKSSIWAVTQSGLVVLCRSCDKRLWSHLDVSRCSPLSNQALAGIVKRQPTSLDLSWTPLAKRQLNCLLTRLPGTHTHTRTRTHAYHAVSTCPITPYPPICLKNVPGLRELRVTGLSWSCLSALVSPTLPYLRLLDLRWCEGLKDAQIKEIILPPGQ